MNEHAGRFITNLIHTYNRSQLARYCRDTGQPYRDFQTTVGEQSLFAVREEKRTLVIRKGVQLAIKTIELLERGFTNSYDLSWNPEEADVVPTIIAKSKRFYLRRLLRHDPSVIAAINGGFFFLADEAAFEPADKTLNLCIQDGKVVGLPVVDRAVLFVKERKLVGKEINAIGKMMIGDQEIAWVGAQSSQRELLSDTPVLYNSACGATEHQPDAGFAFGLKRVLTVEKNFTPKKENVYDLVINKDANNDLHVTGINQGGGTNFFDGLFIIQVKGTSEIHTLQNAQVVPTEIDDINIRMFDAGITVGPSVHHFRLHDDHKINHDLSLGSLPPFERGKRKARTVIYKQDGIMHMRVFDGAPFTTDFKGVTMDEVSNIIGEEGFYWGYHCDPGHSSRLVVQNSNEEMIIMGSKQKFLRPKDKSLPKLWNWLNGTPITSAIVLKEILS